MKLLFVITGGESVIILTYDATDSRAQNVLHKRGKKCESWKAVSPQIYESNIQLFHMTNEVK